MIMTDYFDLRLRTRTDHSPTVTDAGSEWQILDDRLRAKTSFAQKLFVRQVYSIMSQCGPKVSIIARHYN